MFNAYFVYNFNFCLLEVPLCKVVKATGIITSNEEEIKHLFAAQNFFYVSQVFFNTKFQHVLTNII